MREIKKFGRQAIAAVGVALASFAGPSLAAEYSFTQQINLLSAETNALFGALSGTFVAEDANNDGSISLDLTGALDPLFPTEISEMTLRFDGTFGVGGSDASFGPLLSTGSGANLFPLSFIWDISQNKVSNVQVTGNIDLGTPTVANRSFNWFGNSVDGSQLTYYYPDPNSPADQLTLTSFAGDTALVAEVPEPSVYALMLAGLATLAAARRKRRHS